VLYSLNGCGTIPSFTIALTLGRSNRIENLAGGDGSAGQVWIFVKRASTAVLVLLGASSAVVGLVLAFQQWYPKASSDGKIAIVVLSVYVAVVTLAVVVQEYHYARKARYAEALTHIGRIFVEVEHLNSSSPTADEIENTLTIITSELSNSFSLISSTKCSVCIKKIEEDLEAEVGHPSRPRVGTLCRDGSSPKRWVSSADAIHWLDRNTDFHALHEAAGTPNGAHFFENYLPWLRNYENTSFQIYRSRAPWDTNIPVIGSLLRNIFWPLPYRSTVVVPIHPRPGARSTHPRLVGYLCVDSRSLGAFRRRYDIDLITGVADCLYGPVHRFRQLERG
jgi:hypothetical protein